MFEYEVLRFIWWLLIGVLCIGFAVTDGFDMGVGILSNVIGKTDTERRVMINSIAPHWMVTKFGLSLRVVPCLQPGHLFTQLRFLVSTSQWYLR